MILLSEFDEIWNKHKIYSYSQQEYILDERAFVRVLKDVLQVERKKCFKYYSDHTEDIPEKQNLIKYYILKTKLEISDNEFI